MSLLAFAEQNLLEIVLAAAVLFAWLLVEYTLFHRKGKAISNKELIRLLNDEDALLVDVRTEKEFQRGHIRKSVHCDLKQVKEKLGSDTDLAEKPIVFCCTYGAKSGHAAQSLHDTGLKNIHRLRGGVMGWESENLPLQKGRV